MLETSGSAFRSIVPRTIPGETDLRTKLAAFLRRELLKLLPTALRDAFAPIRDLHQRRRTNSLKTRTRHPYR